MCESLFKKHPFVMGGCDFSFGSYKLGACMLFVLSDTCCYMNMHVLSIRSMK